MTTHLDELLRAHPDLVAAVSSGTPARFRHALEGDPSLTHEAVIRLAGKVPRRWATAHAADHPVVTEECRAVHGDPAELARTIASNNSRLTLFRLEHSDTFRPMLDRVLDQVVPLLPAAEGAIRRREVAVYLAGPGGSVPAHFDLHHNVLLQVVGHKDIDVGMFDDPEETARRTEEGFDSGHRLSSLPANTTTHQLAPGDGLYIPPYAFHWVKGGSDVSIALSIGFSTERTDRTELVHRANSRLRRVGLSPALSGRHALLDRAKAEGYRRGRLVRRWLHRR